MRAAATVGRCCGRELLGKFLHVRRCICSYMEEGPNGLLIIAESGIFLLQSLTENQRLCKREFMLLHENLVQSCLPFDWRLEPLQLSENLVQSCKITGHSLSQQNSNVAWLTGTIQLSRK